MKSILLSIRPEWVAKILNGEKTIEIRKKFPKDYVGWVYVCCAKGKETCMSYQCYYGDKDAIKYTCTTNQIAIEQVGLEILNGKVCCRFWCDEVGAVYEDSWLFHPYYEVIFKDEMLEAEDFYKKCCLTYKDLKKYLGSKNGYAIHISKLEVFDKPRELYKMWVSIKNDNTGFVGGTKPLTKAPQNYCYIESEE